MGLNERSSGGSSAFLKIRNDVHSICLESKEFVEGWEEINPNNPTTGQPTKKWIKKYSSIDGMIKYMRWEESDFGPRVKIGMQDGAEYFQLELPYGTREYDSFMKLCENIDYSKPVEFSAWHDKKDDKTAFCVRQDGATIKWKYTKDDMGDCPEPVHNARAKTWNFDAQREWLIDRLITMVIPRVEELNKFDEPMPDYSGVSDDGPVEHEAPKAKGKGKAAKASAAPEVAMSEGDSGDDTENLW